MRELKFRVWDGEKFLRSSFGKKDAEFISLKIEGGILPQYGGFINYHKTMVVQQYTGLNDNNGKDIYIGDILKWGKADVGRELVEVRWSEEGHDSHPCIIYSDNYSQGCGFEVVGNIFENSELLKQ